MNYNIRFPIGDWSQDGHNKCEWFIVESNKTVDELREIHFKCKKMFGFEIGDLCSEYNQQAINEDIQEKLKEFEIDHSFIEDFTWIDSEEMIQLWLNILMRIDKSLVLKIITISTISFYGFDDKKRCFKGPGYGLFE